MREEILEALIVVRELRPRYIIEIGTAAGGTLLLWSRVAHPEATIVTIDLRGGEFGGGYSRSRALLLRHLGLPGQKIHLIRADSHDPATVDLAERLLHGNAVDFLFIDADHTEAGVRTDYKLYSPLMRRGGIIAFHDIAIDWPGYGVKKFWDEVPTTQRARAIIGSEQAYGIGLLYC